MRLIDSNRGGLTERSLDTAGRRFDIPAHDGADDHA